MKDFRQTVGSGQWAGVSGPEAVTENWEPYRQPSRGSDVAVPLLQAVISASLLTAVVGCTIWLGNDGGWAALLLLVFTGLLSAFWFWSLGWVKSTLHKVETLMHQDLNGDGVVGAEPDLHPVVVNSERPRASDAAAAERQRRLREFVVAGFHAGTGVRALKTAGFTDAEIEMFGAYLRDLGVAAWVSETYHKAGWRYLRSQEQIEQVIERTVWVPNQAAVRR